MPKSLNDTTDIPAEDTLDDVPPSRIITDMSLNRERKPNIPKIIEYKRDPDSPSYSLLNFQ